MSLLAFFTALLIVTIAGLAVWRALDYRAETAAWHRLIAMEAGCEVRFNSGMVADLPEPARRYFNYTIQPDTRLTSVVEVEMIGELSLGNPLAPNYRPMRAKQILCLPYGFIWSLKSGAISGSDGVVAARSWTRFWLFNLIPVARVTGLDHKRAAFGRLVADSAFWAPASMLPAPGVCWEPLGDHSARVTLKHAELSQTIDIHVNDEGAPVTVVFQRWSDANPQHKYQYQPFGGDLSEFQDFEGYRLPTRVLAGNHYGTPDYFAFFKAEVTGIRFPKKPGL